MYCVRIFLLFFVFLSFTLHGQEPVSWSNSIEKISENKYKLIFDAKIEKGWYLYSTKKIKDGPIPTSFNYTIDSTKIIFKDVIPRRTPNEEYDKFFEIDLEFFEKNIGFEQSIEINSNDLDYINGYIEFQTCNDEICLFRTKEFYFPLVENAKQIYEKITLSDRDVFLSDKIDLKIEDKSLLKKESIKSGFYEYLNLFVLGFLGGLIALLTPCIFPMIPLTVSFFIKNSNGKGISNAILYGCFIVLIYILLSAPFHLFDFINPQILNNLSTNVTVNILFFLIFIFFAFSFFGFYDISLPSSWSNKTDSFSSNNFIGIFFMALTLAIVSFSCTGPILGSLLVGSITNESNPIELTLAMSGFGFALALPFSILSVFPSILSKIPSSGIWMKNIKVILGFLELALAFKFLSNADLVSHWNILPREIFIFIWFLLAILISLYLFGVYKFPGEKKRSINLSQKVSGSMFFIISLWILSGLNYNFNEMKILSGLLPPKFYSINSDENDCPLNLNCYKEFDEGRKISEDENKPILLDFTGWACVNCRKIEQNVWSIKKIYDLISNEFILISLYVDDRKRLLDEEQFVYKFKNGKIKNIKTIGDKWSTFQAINFSSASQPYYILLYPDGKIINSPIQYTDSETYYNWLKEGLNKFKTK
mgnify:FL=1